MLNSKKSNSHFEPAFKIKLLPDSKHANSRFDFAINNILPKSKRSQGEIIGAVILVLIVVAVSIIVLSFAVPFVRERLAETSCFDLAGQVTFSEGRYTCFDNKGNTVDTDDKINLQIHIGDVNESLDGFIVELGGADSKSIEIKEGVTISNPDVKMYDGSTTLVLPGKNEERTYVITDKLPDYVRLYPILKGGKTCDLADTINKLDRCL